MFKAIPAAKSESDYNWIQVMSVLLFSAVLGLTIGLNSTPAPSHPAVTANTAHKAENVEQRKDLIAQYLAKKFKQPLTNMRKYVSKAWVEAEKHPDVTPELIIAIMQKESSMRPNQRSNYGAEGLMQVVRRFHSEKLAKHESLMDSDVNIRVGAQVLQEYLSQKKSLPLALKKYSGNARGYHDFVAEEIEILKAI